MNKTGPRDDASLAAIRLELWPRSNWNWWPPSSESAQNLQRRFWTRHEDACRISCVAGELAGERVFVPRGFGQRLLGAMKGYGVLTPLGGNGPACHWRPMKRAEIRRLGVSDAGDADDADGVELEGLAEEALRLSGKTEAFFRDPSGVVLPADRWYPRLVFWGQVKARVTKALAEARPTAMSVVPVYRPGVS